MLLLALLAAYTVFLIVQSRRETQATRDEYAEAMPPQRAWDRHWAAQLALVLGGLALLVLGSMQDAAVDAALASVVGGLVRACVIGLPTSVGYGVGLGGLTALGAMLTSCASGVVVVNIDNGFGAAMLVHRIAPGTSEERP